MKKWWVMIFCSGYIFFACRDEFVYVPCDDPTNPFCPNFDSCLVFFPAKAEFMVKDSVPGISCFGQDPHAIVFETDTTTGGLMVFRSTHEGTSYDWRIGTDTTIYPGRSLTYSFPAVQDSTLIPVRLVICKTPPIACQVQSCDTLQKQIILIPVDSSSLNWSYVIGHFKGATHNGDSSIITISPQGSNPAIIQHFPSDCSNEPLSIDLHRNGFFLPLGPDVCDSVCAVGYLPGDRHRLVIEYTTRYELTNGTIAFLIREWKGRKI